MNNMVKEYQIDKEGLAITQLYIIISITFIASYEPHDL